MKETIGDKKQIWPVCGKKLGDHVPIVWCQLFGAFLNFVTRITIGRKTGSY